MMFNVPVAAVHNVQIDPFMATKFQSKIKPFIAPDRGDCVYFTLKSRRCNYFTQRGQTVHPLYFAKGESSQPRISSFPVPILRAAFGDDYIEYLSKQFPNRHLYVSLVNVAGNFYVKVMYESTFSGSIRNVPDSFTSVCAKTSLYMDKAFAKGMEYPATNLNRMQTMLVGHVFDCLYLYDCLSEPTPVDESGNHSMNVMGGWAIRSWIDEYVELAALNGVPDIRERVNHILSLKAEIKRSKTVDPNNASIKKMEGQLLSVYQNDPPAGKFAFKFDATYH